MVESGRNERRKAETRSRIIGAANGLFEARGYAATSMEDISNAADVAIRTIYLHFDSKAAVLLAHFDDWLEALVDGYAQRPAGEALDVMTERVLAGMADGGWTDNRRLDEMTVLHPVVEFIGDGDAVIAGHVMHRWVGAQERLGEIFRVRGGYEPGAVEPFVDAVAVFAAWMTSMLAVRRQVAEGAGSDLSTHEVGAAAMRSFVTGLGRRE